MKKVQWLHLSDLHLNKQGVENRRIRNQLLKYLDSNNLQIKYIFFTGDLRYAPEGGFSSDTIEFLEDICNCLNVSKDNFFIVPGNHDIDLQNPICLEGKNNVRVYYDFHQGIIKQEDLENIYTGKRDYIDILDQFYNKDNLVLKCSKDILQPHFSIETEDFNILHVDSTLVCSLEKTRDLYIGTNLLMNACEKINQNKPTILLTHYSFDSMHKNEQIVILRLLREYNIQLWLAGHEHRELARMQRDFFYEFQCGNLLYEDDQTRACIFLGEYDPNTYSGSIQMSFWLSPDGWMIYPFLKNNLSAYNFKLQDNTSQVIKFQNVINSYQDKVEEKFKNTFDNVVQKQEFRNLMPCENLYRTDEEEIERKISDFDESYWEGYLYLDGNYSPLLELKVYYYDNESGNVFYISSDSLKFEIKTYMNDDRENNISEISIWYNLSYYTDVSIRLKRFNDIREYLSAETVLIRMIEHEEFDIAYKVKCIGDEKWDELNNNINYWYKRMELIAKIEHFYNIRFVLPKIMTKDDENAICIISDALDYKSCRHLPGIPDKYPGFNKNMILERDLWLNDGAELPKLEMFGYIFKPVAQFLMKGKYVWNVQESMWKSDLEDGIPIRVEFELEDKNLELGMIRKYSFSEVMKEMDQSSIFVLRSSDVLFLQYYEKLINSFNKLKHLYSTYKEQLSNFIIFDMGNSKQKKFIIEGSKEVITRVAANELLNSVVNAGKKLVDEINDMAKFANIKHDQQYENFSDEWTNLNLGYQFLIAMKLYANNGFFPLYLTNDGVGYFDFQEICCTTQNNCRSDLKEIINLTKELIKECELPTDIIDAYPMIRNFIYIVVTAYLKYLLALQPKINEAAIRLDELIESHKGIYIKKGLFKNNIVYMNGEDNNIYALAVDNNLLDNFQEYKETVINDLKESRQGVRNDPVEWDT